MRVLVSDSSILIELSRWSLLEAIFRLPFEFAVPDALFEEELIDLGDTDREHLRRLGLRVESLDEAGMARAVRYQLAKPKLTFHDCLAVTLAVTNDWPLLSGDRRMRTLADNEGVQTYGVLWLIDHLNERRLVPTEDLLAALQGMLADPRSHLPPAELRRRIHQLATS